jgi:cellulose biosynthesis protein BcsQ
MSTKTFCMASAKGGSGKTVLAATFATFLAALGKRVLLIDVDAATNGLSLLYLRQVVEAREAVSDGPEIPVGILDPNEGPLSPVPLDHGVVLLPATYRFQNTEDIGAEVVNERLSRLLPVIGENFDYVFLDAQAGSDPVAHVAMGRSVADEVILVSEYDPLSAAGIDRLKGLFPEELTYERTWILVNKVLPEFATALGDFLEIARYLAPIPWEAEVVRAYARRSLALDLDYGNSFTVAIMNTVAGLLGPDMAREISAWADERATMLREPVTSQISDLEMEQRGLIAERTQLEGSQSRRRVISAGAAAYGTVGVAVGAVLLGIGESSSGLALAVIGLGVAFMTLAIVYYFGLRSISVDAKVTDAQLRRQEERVEQQLRDLQALAATDASELIRRYPSGVGGLKDVP